LIFQHHGGIYLFPAQLHNKDQHSYKVCDTADVQAAPPPPIEEYLSNLTVGSNNEAPTALRRALSKVAARWRMWHATGKISTSRAAATIVAT
jgi:hypothetical protein